MWFFNTILIKRISAHDRGLFHFILYIFVVPTIPEALVPFIPEGNGGDGDDDDDKRWLNKKQSQALAAFILRIKQCVDKKVQFYIIMVVIDLPSNVKRQ